MMADYMNGVIDVAINLTADDCDEIAADSSLGTYVPVSSNASAVIVLSPENEILKTTRSARPSAWAPTAPPLPIRPGAFWPLLQVHAERVQPLL